MGSLTAPIDLRVEHLTEAVGIDVAKPRFSWKLPWSHQGARQTGYQVQVFDGDAVVWDTGETSSDQSHLIEFSGAELKPKTTFLWRVRAQSESGDWSDWSDSAVLETGFQGTDWQAEWIGASWYGTQKTSAPCPYMRTEFELPSPPLRARLYISALGLFEAAINGQQIGHDFLAPGWTDYNTRVYYHTYDVSTMVKEGVNAIGAIVGDGWFCGHIGLAAREQYGDRPWLLAQLEVECADGSRIVVATDSNWRTAQGALLESDILMGEVFDANRELPGWSKTRFDMSDWEPVLIRQEASPKLVGFPRPPIRKVRQLSPAAELAKVDNWTGARWIVDFGQNLVGTVRLKLKAPKGTNMMLRYGEMLNENGSLYTENLRGAKQTDVYVFKGDPEGEVYEPKFTFHGFRYLEISGVPEPPSRDDVQAIVLCSDLEETGQFECSHDLMNQLQSNIVWGQRGNFLDVPTDCPQRDERLGWTGDAQAFVSTATFNMNVAPFFAKWLQDLVDSQKVDGRIPPVAPHPSLKVVSDDGGPGWADALAICPWAIYESYGDLRALELTYEPLCRFLEYLEGTSKGHIRCWLDCGYFRGFGDWLSIGAETPLDLIGTAFYANSVKIAIDMASIVKPDEVSKWQERHRQVVQAFRDRYVTPDGLVASQTQSSYVLALMFGLIPEESRKAAVQELVDDIGRRGWLLTTGFLGTAYVLHALAENGRMDVAFRLLLQTKCPSWLYPVTQGATTIWERWDGWTKDKGFQDPGMNSFNHYAFGAVGSWLYRKLAGIEPGPHVGYKRFILRPCLGGGFRRAEASYVGPYGTIESRWKVDGEAFEWEVCIPPNSSAEVWVPAKQGDKCSTPPDAEFEEFELWRRGYLTSGRYLISVSGPGIEVLSHRGIDSI